MFPNRLTAFRPGFGTGKSQYIFAAVGPFAKGSVHLETQPLETYLPKFLANRCPDKLEFVFIYAFLSV